MFFLFATEMGFIDDCYTDGHVPSVSPLVCFSPTDFIVVTDGMSLSVKLDNVVVQVQHSVGWHACQTRDVWTWK